MNKRQLKVTLLGAAAGFVISEYFVLRRAAKDVRRDLVNKRLDTMRTTYAAFMIGREAERGKYDAMDKEVIDADFEYYQQVAPDFTRRKAKGRG